MESSHKWTEGSGEVGLDYQCEDENGCRTTGDVVAVCWDFGGGASGNGNGLECGGSVGDGVRYKSKEGDKSSIW